MLAHPQAAAFLFFMSIIAGRVIKRKLFSRRAPTGWIPCTAANGCAPGLREYGASTKSAILWGEEVQRRERALTFEKLPIRRCAPGYDVEAGLCPGPLSRRPLPNGRARRPAPTRFQEQKANWELKKVGASDTKLAPTWKGRLKSIFSALGLAAEISPNGPSGPAALLRRTSVLPQANLGAGGIHSRRACKISPGIHKNNHT